MWDVCQTVIITSVSSPPKPRFTLRICIINSLTSVGCNVSLDTPPVLGAKDICGSDIGMCNKHSVCFRGTRNLVPLNLNGEAGCMFSSRVHQTGSTVVVMKLQLLMSTGWIVFLTGIEPKQLYRASLFMVFPVLLHSTPAPPPSVFILLSLHHTAAISHLLINFPRQQITMLFCFHLHLLYSYWNNKVVPATSLFFPYLQGSVRCRGLFRYSISHRE